MPVSFSRMRLGVTFVAVVALILGCGQTNAATPSPAGTLAPIIVGNIGSYSGAYAAGRVGIREGLTAWMLYVNAHGGIGGHPVVVKIYDDGGDPSKAQTIVQGAITNDNVIAFLQNSSTITQTWQSIPANAGIPSINANTITQVGLTFSAGMTGDANPKSYVVAAHAMGAKSFAFAYCAELSICSQARDFAAVQARDFGMTYSSYAVSSSAPSYTALCLAIKQAGTESVQLGVNTANVTRIADECARQGVKTQYIMGATATQPLIQQDPNLEGALVTLLDFPWFQNDTPATKEFQAALRTYAPNITNSANVSATWAVGKVFEKAAAKVGPNPTPREIIDGMFAIPQGETFGGLTPPLAFKPASPVTDLSKYVQPTQSCFFIIQLRKGDWSLPSGRKNALVCP